HQRLESLRSASAFACVSRQSLKRFFRRFGFLHKSILFITQFSLMGHVITVPNALAASHCFGTEQSFVTSPFITTRQEPSTLGFLVSRSFIGGSEIVTAVIFSSSVATEVLVRSIRGFAGLSCPISQSFLGQTNDIL